MRKWCRNLLLLAILLTQLSNFDLWTHEVGKIFAWKARARVEIEIRGANNNTSSSQFISNFVSGIISPPHAVDKPSETLKPTASFSYSTQGETNTTLSTTRKDATSSEMSPSNDTRRERLSATLLQVPVGLNENNLPLCTREEIYQGEWVPVTLSQIPYIPFLRCLPKEHYEIGRPWETWEWLPSAVQSKRCMLQRWNASQFCSLARHSTVAILGDSLSWEQYASLVQLMGLTTAEQLQLDSHAKRKMILNYVCGNQVRLVYLRDDYLAHVNYIIETTSPSVLIINRGAHYTKNNRLKTDLQHVSGQLKEWQRSCETLQRSCLLMVRTTVPGREAS